MGQEIHRITKEGYKLDIVPDERYVIIPKPEVIEILKALDALKRKLQLLIK
jgi:hypothetical protein